MTRQTRSNIHTYDENPGTFQMRGFHQSHEQQKKSLSVLHKEIMCSMTGTVKCVIRYTFYEAFQKLNC